METVADAPDGAMADKVPAWRRTTTPRHTTAEARPTRTAGHRRKNEPFPLLGQIMDSDTTRERPERWFSVEIGALIPTPYLTNQRNRSGILHPAQACHDVSEW